MSLLNLGFTVFYLVYKLIKVRLFYSYSFGRNFDYTQSCMAHRLQKNIYSRGEDIKHNFPMHRGHKPFECEFHTCTPKSSNQYVACINLNIFYCLNNDKRIRHKFFNLVLSSPYTYNIQYTIWWALLLHYFSKIFTWRHETKNVALKQNATMEYY